MESNLNQGKTPGTEGDLTQAEALLRFADIETLEGEEVVARREACAKHFDFGAGRHQAVVFAEPVHFERDGSWQEIDNNLEPVREKGRTMLHNRANPLEIELAEQADDGELVRLTHRGKTLSWRFECAQKAAPAQAKVKDGPALRRERLLKLAERTPQFAQRTASTLSMAELESLETKNERRADMSDRESQVRYDDIAPGVSVRYTLSGQKFKEDIILADRDALSRAAIILNGDLSYGVQPDGGIEVSDKATGEGCFTFDAPITYDANGIEIKAQPILQTTAAGMRLSYAIDGVDLDSAAYPITIDPVVKQWGSSENIWWRILRDDDATESGELKVGRNSSYEYVTFMKIDTLPKVTSADTVISAKLNLTKKTGSTNNFIGVHEVLTSVSSANLSWETLYPYDAEEVCQTPMDCADGSSAAMTFDITNTYRSWYDMDEDDSFSYNNGLILRAYTPTSALQTMYSPNSTTPSNRPKMVVEYISHAGIGGSWEHQSRSNGRSGVSHVDLFNGNLVHEHVDTEMTGQCNPISVSHYYNSCLSDANSLRCGYGWRHSEQQYVREETLAGVAYYVWTDGSGTEHWFKDKGNGAKVFDLETSQYTLVRYAATSSLPPRVVITSRSQYIQTFQKRPSLSNTGTWNNYWLFETKDNAGNTSAYTYKMPETTAGKNSNTEMRALEGILLEVADGSAGGGRITKFAYDSSFQLLESISIPGAEDGDANRRVMRFLYDTNDRLTGICYPDLAYDAAGNTRFIYEEDTNLLKEVRNIDGQTTRIEYEVIDSTAIDEDEVDNMRRVLSIETFSGSSLGEKQVMKYLPLCTEVRPVIAGSTLGKPITYQFGSNGQLTCVKDDLGFAQCSGYADDTGVLLTDVSLMRRAVINRIKCPDLSAGWSVESGSQSATLVPNACMGLNAYSLTGSGRNMEQIVQLEPGKEWTFSAYVQTASTDPAATVYNARLRAIVSGNHDSFVLTSATDAVSAADKALPTDGWQKLHVTFSTPPGSQPIGVRLQFRNDSASGTVLFSGPQLESGDIANSVNLLTNASFSAHAPQSVGGVTHNVPDYWTCSDNAAPFAEAGQVARGTYFDYEFPDGLEGDALYLPGKPAITSINYLQNVTIRGSKDDIFTVGGWANARSIALDGNVKFQIGVKFRKSSGEWVYGTPETYVFNAGWIGWQFITGAVRAPAAYTGVQVFTGYGNNGNGAYFTNLFLHREAFGNSFAYDAMHRKVQSMTNLIEQQRNAVYNADGNMTQYTRFGTDYKYLMAYYSGAQKNLVKAKTSPEKMQTSFAYDPSGNCMTKKQLTDGGAAFIQTSTDYTADRNYKARAYDERNKVTTFAYNARTGMLNSVKNNDNTQIDYGHDGVDRLTSVRLTADDKVYQNEYEYDAFDHLSKIAHNTTTMNDLPQESVEYALGYDALGRQTSISVAGMNLVNKAYGFAGSNQEGVTRGNNLTKVSYGNGQVVRTGYDEYDRPIGISYDGSDPTVTPRFAMAYNATGKVGKVTDSTLQRVVRTDYDQALRPVHSSIEQNGAPIYDTLLRFDKRGNLQRLQEDVDQSSTYRTYYQYDKDDRPVRIAYQKGGALNGIEYVYDNVGRIGQIRRGTATVSGNTITVTPNSNSGTVFGYWGGGYGTNSRSPLVSGLDQGGKMVYYYYDDLGNVTMEKQSDNAYSVQYQYDKLGQLIREDDSRVGVIWQYDYDCGGNMIEKRKYTRVVVSADSGIEGSLLERHAYLYDATWKDKLTRIEVRDGANALINAEYIGYPASGDIGNPASYDAWTLAWQAGRQLKSMSKAGKTYEFVYDHNGMRIGKTEKVGGTVIAQTDYTLYNRLITHLKKGTDELHFFYDAGGRPEMVDFNGSMYIYRRSLQGDIAAILDANGNQVVEYAYSAWGEPVSVTGTLATTLGTLNPFRYRGYVYDAETELYYLKNRYYNPRWSRFINADAEIEQLRDLLSHNPFTYCGNAPVTYGDDDGQFMGALVGAVMGAVMGTVSAIVNHDDNILASAISGAVSGGIAGLAVDAAIATGGLGGVAVAAVFGGIGGGLGSVSNDLLHGNDVDVGNALFSAGIGAVTSAACFGLGRVMAGKLSGTFWEKMCQLGFHKGSTAGNVVGNYVANTYVNAAGFTVTETRNSLRNTESRQGTASNGPRGTASYVRLYRRARPPMDSRSFGYTW